MGEKKEDFPIDSFRYLEGKLQEIRAIAMRRAAENAERQSSPKEIIYRVEKYHIDMALAELFSESSVGAEELRRAIGLKN
ncbi:MAG: hypothetical protein AAB361_00800 [Patescibacteria group bacterium]